jgi:hypothetical protein
MSLTTFSGPVKIGPIKFTTGTTVGLNVANIGTAQLAQTAAVTQATTTVTTTIVIPANSTILSIALFVTTAWSGGAATLGLGTAANTAYNLSANPTFFTTAGGVTGSVGTNYITTTGATQAANWIATGANDLQITVTNTNTGAGVGTLVVEYFTNIPQYTNASPV